MNPNDFPPFIQDLRYARDNDLLTDPVGRAVERILHSGLDDRFSHEWVTTAASRHRVGSFLDGPFLPAKLHRGEITEGFDLQGRPVRTPLQARNAHEILISATGNGKSNRAKWLILQTAPRTRGGWYVDLRKREFRVMRPYLRRVGVDLIVLPARRMRLNPLQVPEHVDPVDWAPRVADLLVHALVLPRRSAQLVHATTFKLYRRFEITSR